jgi:anoctamin-4
MYNWWSKRLHRSNTKNLERKYTLWEEDFQLQDPGRLALFEEYLEMGMYVLQLPASVQSRNRPSV